MMCWIQRSTALCAALFALTTAAACGGDDDNNETNNSNANNSNNSNNSNNTNNSNNANNTNNTNNTNNIHNNQSGKYEVISLDAAITGDFTAAWTKEELKFEGYCVFNAAELNWSGPDDTLIKLSLKLDEAKNYTFESMTNEHFMELGIGQLTVGSPSGDFYTRFASSSTITFTEVPERSGGGNLKGSLNLNLKNPNKAESGPINVVLNFDHKFSAHLCE